MKETKFDWDDLRLFLAVARNGGLAAAAPDTGKSAPTLGRRMLALERRIGHELFVRLPRGYELTENGQRLLDLAADLESGILPVVASNERTAPIVKVSAGTWVTHHLCQRVPEILEGNRVILRFIAADEVLDIGRREAVIGIRNHRPEQIGLARQRIGKVQFAVYATDDGVETWARVMGKTPSALWLRDNIGDAPSIEVTNARNALDLALEGAARIVLPTFIGNGCKELQQVSSLIEELEHDQWLVTHNEDRHLPEVRRTIDQVFKTLRNLCSV